MFFDLKALEECAREGAIAVRLCTQTETLPDYDIGIPSSSNYNCRLVRGYAYVDKYSQIAVAGSSPSQMAWYVVLFPPIPEIRVSDRFLIQGKYYQIEETQPIMNRGVLIAVKYHCLRKT